MEGKELVTSKKGAVIVQYRKEDEQHVCTATHSFPITYASRVMKQQTVPSYLQNKNTSSKSVGYIVT